METALPPFARTALATAAVAALLGVGVAVADDPSPLTVPDPYATGEQMLNDHRDVVPDTDYTPIAKEGLWHLIQGARYDQHGPEARAGYEARAAASQGGADEQVTSFDDQLTTVSFVNTRNGFGAGERKIDCDGDGSPDTYVPVVYRYGDSPTGSRWLAPDDHDGGLLGDCTHSGFVGRIAWIRTTGMALAVGGTGSYPYREPAYDRSGCNDLATAGVTKPYGAGCDQAGVGRAWLYNHGHWQELDHDPHNFPAPAADGAWGSGIHGMTALDFSPLPGKNFGFVGGLGQLWPVLVKVDGQNGPCPAEDANDCVSFPADGKIPDLGGSVGKFDMSSTQTGGTVPGDIDDAFRFRFRVRQVRVAASASGTLLFGAAAATDGCCAPDTGPQSASNPQNYPSLILFSNQPRAVPGTIGIAGLGAKQVWHWTLRSADTYGQAFEPSAYYGVPDAQRRQLPSVNPRQDWPDSFFSLTLQMSNVGFSPAYKVGLVAAPGGPSGSAPERPSVVTEPICSNDSAFAAFPLDTPLGLSDWTQPGPLFSALRAQLSSVRLVDGDGDDQVAFTMLGVAPPLATPHTAPPAAGDPSNLQRQTNDQTCVQGGETRETPHSGGGGTLSTSSNVDAVPDWVVGELRSSEQPGLESRGLAFSTVSRPTLIPDTLDVGMYGEDATVIDPSHILGDPTNYRPTTPDKLAAYLQSQYFFTDSYALNAISYISHTGTAWAVGAHGGIVQMGGSGGDLASRKTVEPAPPPLGARSAGTPPDRSPYAGFDALPSTAGAVPALAARPALHLPAPELSFAGAPDAAPDYGRRENRLGQIVMSRDGSEGWGLDRTSSPGGSLAMTLFHYGAGQWSRCDPEGIDGVLPADPACSSLAPLRAYAVKGVTKGVAIGAAARVPYENGDDPADADRFEVVALGTAYITPDEAAKQGDSVHVTPTLLRYRDGAWSVDDDGDVRSFIAQALGTGFGTDQGYGNFGSDLSLAFASPRDGWLLEQTSPNHLLHYDGERWIDCSTDPAADPAGTKVGDPDNSGVGNPTTTPPRPGTSDGRFGTAEDRKSWCDDPAKLTISVGGKVPTGTNTGSQDYDTFTGITQAGDRLFLFGTRTVSGQSYPVVLCKRAGQAWTSAGCGLDPGFVVRRGAASAGLTGSLYSLSVAADADGKLHGWATGSFGARTVAPAGRTARLRVPPTAVLLRLGDGGWARFADAGPVRDRLSTAAGADTASSGVQPPASRSMVVAQPDGGGLVVAPTQTGLGPVYLRFDLAAQGWRLLPADLRPANSTDVAGGSNDGWPVAAAADGRDGAWVGLRELILGAPTDFLHYTATPPEPVFSEVPTPLRSADQSLTGLAGEPDGTLWATSSGPVLYRYERTTGWDAITIPGWQTARATVAPQAYAIAVNPSGVGVVVGREGRIADIGGGQVQLDQAAGTVCDLAHVVAPCGTSRHLRAAAPAPDGSAMVGGEYLSLLWRPAGGDFRAIEKPEAPAGADVTGVSLPTPGRAYLTTTSGQLFRGERSGDHWSWTLENVDAGQGLLTRDPSGVAPPLSLWAVAVDDSGHGYAAGDAGVLLERTGDGEHPWRRIRSGVSDSLSEIVLGPDSALIGGVNGLVLTGSGEHFALARSADQSGEATGTVVGLALVPGSKSGQAEAWAATDGQGARPGALSISQLFHYSSDPDDPLLNPQSAMVAPLPDAPAPRTGELSFAALGKIDCHRDQSRCTGFASVGADYAALSHAIARRIAADARAPDGPSFALFTGDAVDDAGIAGYATTEDNATMPKVGGAFFDVIGPGHIAGTTKLRDFRSWIEEPLARAGLGPYDAIGGQDLSGYKPCPDAGGGSCLPTDEAERAGMNDAWRKSFGDAPGPWGTGTRTTLGGRYRVVPLAPSGRELSPDDQSVATGTDAGDVRVPLAGANTHYAFDLVEDDGGKPVARIVFADNSLRSLAASDAVQRPVEAGGQSQWLDRVLCFKGSDSDCSREAGEPAIVVANAPTYSYESTNPAYNATDGTAFEAQLLRDRVSVVVSGSLGWNGRYWATAPGVHEPCPGDSYMPDDRVPDSESRTCGQATPGSDRAQAAARRLAVGLADTLGPPPPPADGLAAVAGGAGVLPFVVASGAGGKFGGQGGGTAGQGFWHGHTLVRLPADGDPRGLIVEQRPLLDYVTLRAATHVVRPGQRLTLRGVGREPIAYDSASSGNRQRDTRFDEIDTSAITHRYDLVEADPDAPWRPKVLDGNGEPHGYVPLDPTIATVDQQSGKVVASRSNHSRVYALAILSVGDKAASYPIVFEPKRSYIAPRASIIAPPPVPQVRVLGLSAQALQAPPPPPAASTPPISTNLNLPSPPALPTFPSATAPPLAPPAPPAPPPPPPGQQAIPLNLSVNPVGIAVPPTPGVTAQPTPPVQPAPPSGARREAKQRQAATAKSEEGSVGDESQQGAGDLAQGPIGPQASPMTRRDRVKPAPDGFTPRRERAQPSAWTTGLARGGSIGLMALCLALGFVTVRPTPRRRAPELPAPAWARRPRR